MGSKRSSTPDAEPFRLALRVRHPSIDPGDLSRAFDIEAEHSFRAGGPRPSRDGRTEGSVHSESYWIGILDTTRQWPGLSFVENYKTQLAQRQLAAARKSLGWALCLGCARFLKLHSELLRCIRSEGGEVAILINISSGEIGSFSIEPEASQLFGELGVVLEFEFASD